MANAVAPLADHAFGLNRPARRPHRLGGALAYALQIYFDFCGYSNMAIGLAFMLGFTFPKNFEHPYAARLDHRVLAALAYLAVQLVSRLRLHPAGRQPRRRLEDRAHLLSCSCSPASGTAAWNFVAWGLWHGGFLLLERFGLAALLARTPRLVGHAYALLAVSSAGCCSVAPH